MNFPLSILNPRARHSTALEDAPYLAALIATAVTVALMMLLPYEAVLPAASIVLVTLAFGLAAIAYRRRSASPTPSWYVSAALAFIGFGAAFLADAEQVLPLLEGTRRDP